jgi:hypothetical protein
MELTKEELLALLLMLEHEAHVFGLNKHEITAAEKLQEKYKELGGNESWVF